VRLKHLVPGAAIAVVALAAPMTGVAQAAGSDPTASATFVSDIETSQGATSARLKVEYQCSSGDTLWISAKQTKSGQKRWWLMLGGSSQWSAAWWQSHRNPITCDGASHTQWFTLDTVEPGSKGSFVDDGQAWVQFCVTANQQDLTLSVSGWVRTDTDEDEDD
jgi:hypothetical protein